MKNHLLTLALIFVLTIPMCYSQNHAPVAVNDFAVTTRGYVKFDVVDNDSDPDGNYIRVFIINKKPRNGTAVKLNDSIIEYRAFPHYSGGYDTLQYMLRDNGNPYMMDTAVLVLQVDNPLTLDSVHVNNIKAGVNADGFLFCEHAGQNFRPVFEVPAGSGINSMFSGSLWIGGLDLNGNLHLAAMQYGQNGSDFWAGPISALYDSAYEHRYNRVWKVTKADIDYHVAHCWQPGYVPAQALIDWPGNGNQAVGEAPVIAPFHDVLNDGIYDPWAGDYPIIKGDETIFFIFNDARYPHTETNGNKLGIEVHGMLYAIDCPSDSAFRNTVFVHYRIYNYSTYQYNQTYIGSYMDVDLGDPWDDYVGCDVQRGSFYAYNGTNADGNGGPGTYGAHPPAQSMTFLGGPYMDSDGLDNPRLDNLGNLICDVGINGMNFGDSIIDNERFGLTRFVYFNNTGGFWAMTDPSNATEFYNLMRGIWKDGEQMRYWGNAHPNAGGTGPVCSFMFPGTSDPCNWGTYGVDPGIIDPWTEAQAGNTPYDRRGIGITGPFTFEPGKYEDFDLAFVFGRDFSDTSNTAAIPVMQQRIDTIRSYFFNDMTPCGGGFSGIKAIKDAAANLTLYPNPAGDDITIEYTVKGTAVYKIYDLTGRELRSGMLAETNRTTIDISSFKSGLYMLTVKDSSNMLCRKFIKR
jgi:hypothetical protein